MSKRFTATAVLMLAGLVSGPAFAQTTLTVAFADPAWTGETVPEGQHCPLQGGSGATPTLTVSGLPEGTTQVNVEFNDESYEPLSTDGGHGIIGFAVTPAGRAATLPSVPGNTAELPEGTMVVAAARAPGDYASPGYLPPCSGGNGNTYSADVIALDAAGAELATGKITLGKY